MLSIPCIDPKRTLTATLLLLSVAASAYGNDVVAYFTETVLGTESGTGVLAVRKWSVDLAIEIRGMPTDKDRRTCSAVMQDLNELVAPLKLRFASGDPNVIIHFLPEAEFSTVLPEYRPPNRGFHWVSWDEHGNIYEATILISTIGVTQAERAHMIREELTQSLGFLMDSPRYPDSIFYSGWTTTDRFSDLDEQVIRLLYSPEIEAGSKPSWARGNN